MLTTPRGCTLGSNAVAQVENSDVFPAGSVAVAVIESPLTTEPAAGVEMIEVKLVG